jgi:enoyl-CoA hydratase/carnithine racemase
MFLGDAVSAADCERYGIANRVVPAADLARTVDELAGRSPPDRPRPSP